MHSSGKGTPPDHCLEGSGGYACIHFLMKSPMLPTPSLPPFRMGPPAPTAIKARLVPVVLGVMAVAGVWAAASTVFGMDGPLPVVESAGNTVIEGLEESRRANRILRAEVELAEAGGAYLFMDLQGGWLAVKSHGTLLREFPIIRSGIRKSRNPLSVRRTPQALDTVWNQGFLLEARRFERHTLFSDSVSAPDLSATVSYVPPTPEERFPTPASFRIRCSGGLSIVVAPAAGDPSEGGSQLTSGRSLDGVFGSVRHWIRLRPWLRDDFRVDLEMTRSEAGALYRAFTDGTPILVSGLESQVR